MKSVAGICHSGAPPLAAPDRTLLVESRLLLEAFILNASHTALHDFALEALILNASHTVLHNFALEGNELAFA